MDQLYLEFLQQEINSRYIRSRKIYNLKCSVHIIKILLIFSFLTTNGSFNHCEFFTIWLIIYSVIIALSNIICWSRIRTDPNDVIAHQKISSIGAIINISDICWLFFGIYLVYTNHSTCKPLSNFIFGLILFDIIADILLFLLNICLCCTTCLLFIIRAPLFNDLVTYISEPTGMNEMDINLIPVNKYSEIQMEQKLECAICLTEFDANDDVRQFICKHIFHKNCIDIWLQLNAVCPMCRQPVITRYETEDVNYLPTYIQQYNQDSNNVIYID